MIFLIIKIPVKLSLDAASIAAQATVSLLSRYSIVGVSQLYCRKSQFKTALSLGLGSYLTSNLASRISTNGGHVDPE